MVLIDVGPDIFQPRHQIHGLKCTLHFFFPVSFFTQTILELLDPALAITARLRALSQVVLSKYRSLLRYVYSIKGGEGTARGGRCHPAFGTGKARLPSGDPGDPGSESVRLGPRTSN